MPGVFSVSACGAKCPPSGVDEELEELELELRVAKPHLLGHRLVDLPSKPVPGGAVELHPVRTDLARVANGRVDQRLLATTVGRGLGETEQPRDVFGRRRACENAARHLDHRTLFTLARRPRPGGQLGLEHLDEPGTVAAVGHMRRVRAPLAGTKVIAHGRVHHQRSGCSPAAGTFTSVSIGSRDAPGRGAWTPAPGRASKLMHHSSPDVPRPTRLRAGRGDEHVLRAVLRHEPWRVQRGGEYSGPTSWIWASRMLQFRGRAMSGPALRKSTSAGNAPTNMPLGLAPIHRLYLYPTSVSERQHRRLAPLGDGGALPALGRGEPA